jgi:ADP-ribose pyrophosphatase YjhB (NUDIX family)
MTQVKLPPAEYYKRLPKQITGAGVIFHDAEFRILLVQTTYREDGTWEIPGGEVDTDHEFPYDAAKREIRQECGLEDVEPGRLLVVDWVPPQDDGRPMLINFLFDGGRLADEQVAAMSCNDGEIAAWKFCNRDEYEARLLPHMVRRVDACIDALRSGKTSVLHHGYAPGDASMMGEVAESA